MTICTRQPEVQMLGGKFFGLFVCPLLDVGPLPAYCTAPRQIYFADVGVWGVCNAP